MAEHELFTLTPTEQQYVMSGLKLLAERYKKMGRDASALNDDIITTEAETQQREVERLAERFLPPSDQQEMFDADEAPPEPVPPLLGADEGLTEPDDTF